MNRPVWIKISLRFLFPILCLCLAPQTFSAEAPALPYDLQQALADFKISRFDLIDEKCAQLLKGSETDRTMLSLIYAGLGKGSEIPILDRWAKRNTNSSAAQACLGLANLSYVAGAHRRGNDGAYKRRLTDGKDFIDKACELEPGNPNLMALKIMALRLVAPDDAAMEKIFEAGLKLDPQCFSLYAQKALYLTWPDPERCKTFVDQVVQKAAPGSRLGLLTVVYHEFMWNKQGYLGYLTDPATWKEIQGSFDSYLKLHPADVSTLSWYARLSFVTSKYNLASKQFVKLADESWVYGGWESLNAYMGAKTHSWEQATKIQ